MNTSHTDYHIFIFFVYCKDRIVLITFNSGLYITDINHLNRTRIFRLQRLDTNVTQYLLAIFVHSNLNRIIVHSISDFTIYAVIHCILPCSIHHFEMAHDSVFPFNAGDSQRFRLTKKVQGTIPCSLVYIIIFNPTSVGNCIFQLILKSFGFSFQVFYPVV